VDIKLYCILSGIFSCIHWPFIFLLQRTLFKSLPIFFILLLRYFVYIVHIEVFKISYTTYKCFLSLYRLSFQSLASVVWVTKGFDFDMSTLSSISFATWAFVLFSETGSPYIAQGDLELLIFLPQPIERWDYTCIPPCLILFCVLSIVFLFNYII
jgi:hypothetical protein